MRHPDECPWNHDPRWGAWRFALSTLFRSGGGTAYMLQQVLERQGGYHWLDAEPRTLAAKEHRPAYGSDGDYWSKPNRETPRASPKPLVAPVQ